MGDFFTKVVNPIGSLANGLVGGVTKSLLGTSSDVGGAPTYQNARGGFVQFTPGMASSGIAAPQLGDFERQNVGDLYKGKDFSGSLPEFDTIRANARSMANAEKSGAMEALARKYAAMGNLNSGSYIKQSRLTDQGYNQAASKMLADIGAQEAQQRRALQQAEGNKEFQSREAYNAAKRQEGQNVFENATKLRALDLALFKANQEAQDSAFNAEMANYQARYSEKNTGGLLGGGGFLGTGLFK